jgi:hypothetical protein
MMAYIRLAQTPRDHTTTDTTTACAQAMLSALLRRHRPAVLANVSGLTELLDGLEVYTQRHLARLDRLVRSTYLLDYTLASMKVGLDSASVCLEFELQSRVITDHLHPAAHPHVPPGAPRKGAGSGGRRRRCCRCRRC